MIGNPKDLHKSSLYYCTCLSVCLYLYDCLYQVTWLPAVHRENLDCQSYASVLNVVLANIPHIRRVI